MAYTHVYYRILPRSQIKSPISSSKHNEHIKTHNSKQVLFSTIDCDEISAFLENVKGKHGLLIRVGVSIT